MQGREHSWLDAIAEPTRLYILRALLRVPDATVAELMASRTSAQTLRRHLDALVSTGVIAEYAGESDGETPGRPAARFRLVPEVREGLSLLIAMSLNQGETDSVSYEPPIATLLPAQRRRSWRKLSSQPSPPSALD